MRDCDNCARCGRDGCKSWDCDFVPRKEAIEAWKEKHETADRKTESNSEIPNNCEHITEDGVTCAKYPACDYCLDNPLNKVKGSERLLKGKTEPTISKMEQVDKDINVRSKTEPKTQTETQNSNLTFEKDECAKEYEELGLKELKELIEADRKTESNSEKPNNSTISKMEQVEDEPQTNHLVKTPSKSRDGHEIADAPLTDAEITELAKEIVHKMIDNSVIAEDAYPGLRQRMHEAVERLGEYYYSEDERSK